MGEKVLAPVVRVRPSKASSEAVIWHIGDRIATRALGGAAMSSVDRVNERAPTLCKEL